MNGHPHLASSCPLQLDADTVGHYQRATAAISELEAAGVAQALPGARERLKSTQQRLKLQARRAGGVCGERDGWGIGAGELGVGIVGGRKGRRGPEGPERAGGQGCKGTTPCERHTCVC